MTEHCGECGAELCGHGHCPRCQLCEHCNGGDRDNKFFGYDEDGNENQRPSGR
jgi:hypothetical protein